MPRDVTAGWSLLDRNSAIGSPGKIRAWELQLSISTMTVTRPDRVHDRQSARQNQGTTAWASGWMRMETSPAVGSWIAIPDWFSFETSTAPSPFPDLDGDGIQNSSS